jgi:hypothetical protein
MSYEPTIVNLPTNSPAPTPTSQETAESTPSVAVSRPESRIGRKQIAGFFTTEMSFAMHMVARRQGRSLQALMAEAFNDVLRKHGENSIGD